MDILELSRKLNMDQVLEIIRLKYPGSSVNILLAETVPVTLVHPEQNKPPSEKPRPPEWISSSEAFGLLGDILEGKSERAKYSKLRRMVDKKEIVSRQKDGVGTKIEYLAESVRDYIEGR